jgi:UDP:flavonoid glycosyltransferase YjiC (YdhE family)
MRVLFTTNPMYGHVNTVLPLARAARAAGHDVAFATGPDLVARAQRAGLVTWPVGPTHQEAGGGADADWMEYFAVSAQKRADDLVPRARRWRPDLVVSEETELAGPVVAAATGARSAIHGLGIMPPPRIWEAFAGMLTRLYEYWHIDDDVEALRDAPYLEICPPALRAPDERIWRSTLDVRPAVGEPAVGERLPEALDRLPYPDTVHLTLGTVFHGNRAVLQTALAGLRDLPVNVVVAAGPEADADAFGPQPAHVVIVPYVPHALLLPRCRVVMSQGGAGVMFGALAHGLAQLVIPQGAEQFLNAEAGQRAGASLTLLPDEVTPAAVRAAVARLLDDPTITAAAAAVRTEIERMPTADAALASLVAATRR